jgi:hypothetical protein
LEFFSALSDVFSDVFAMNASLSWLP